MRNACKCGERSKVVRGNYLFLESGLDNVVLRRVKLLKCEQCGSVTPMLSKINQLMRLIACALVLKHSELTGKEVRFLRKYAGLTGEQFGRKLGLTKEHISRMENDKHPVGTQTERLVRYLAVSADASLPCELKQLFALLDSIQKKPLKARIEIDPETGSFEYAAA
jgi:transcriptional regulator with XRE-family HTH domain